MWNNETHSRMYKSSRDEILSATCHRIKLQLSNAIEGLITVKYFEDSDDIFITITLCDTTFKTRLRDALSAVRKGVQSSQLAYKVKEEYKKKILQKYFKNVS